MQSRSRLTLAVASVLALAGNAAWADAKIERFTHFGGVLGIGASDIATVEYLQGLKMREESNLKFTGSVLGGLQKLMGGANGKDSIAILRVDENKHYSLDPKAKTYRETPIYTPPKATQHKEGRKEDDTKVTKNELDVKETGAKKAVNGFACREYQITWLLETVNLKTGKKGKSLMTTDMWNSDDSKLKALRDQELSYGKAFLTLMHIPYTPDQAKQYGFGQVQMDYLTEEDMRKFFAKLATIKGYPVSLDVLWKAEGSAAPDTAGKDAEGDAGMLNIFSSHTELKSVDTASLKSDLFTIPPGYTEGE